jgi:tetratricopeptide (TPR) repeat protein
MAPLVLRRRTGGWQGEGTQMADIRLQDYVAKIKEMIRADRHDEAIAHCQHILKHYPKHIDTYELLGEACLEKEMYRESIEFFQRTLSANPESFIARVGLGILYDEQGAIPEAIWQMERAFELVPGNPEVRRELQRLYAQRDGKEKSRLKLTRGALGRLYARNGLYERAITEFRAVLRQEPDLPDVRVAMVEALWREGRRLEAVEACLELLDALPNCLKANLILAEIWMRGGHVDASEEKLALARALDPESLVAQEMMGRDSPLTSQEVLISQLETRPGMGLMIPTVEAAAPVPWGGEAEELVVYGEESDAFEAAEWESSEGLPDWLREIGVTEVETSVSSLDAEATTIVAEQIEEEKAVPDWLKELTGKEAGPQAAEGVPPTEEELPAMEEISLGETVSAEEETTPEVAVPEQARPEWQAESEGPEAGQAAPLEEGVPEAEELAAPGAVPDWLRELSEPRAEEAEPLLEEEPGFEDLTPADEIPDWLRELEPRTGKIGPAVAEVPVEEDEIPDWLRDLREPMEEEAAAPPSRQLAEEPVPAEETAPEEEAAPAEAVPDWLKGTVGVMGAAALAKEIVSSPEETAGAEEITPDEEIPPWLRDLPEVEAPQAEEPTAEETDLEEEVPDWLRDLPKVEEPVAEEAGPEEETPDWLRDLQWAEEPKVEEPVAEEAGPEEETPDWLRDLQWAEEPEVEEPVAEEAGPEEETPDWLRDLQWAEEPEVEEPVAEEAGPEEETPDWLRDLQWAEEPEVEETAEPPAETPVEATVSAAAGVPESLLALVTAGILDEADLESAMAEMSTEDLEAQRAEEVPGWLRELMDEETDLAAKEVAPPDAEEPWAEEAVLAEVELEIKESVDEEASLEEEVAPEEEIPAWLLELEEIEEPVTEEAEAEEVALEEEIPAWLRGLEEVVEPEIEGPVAEAAAKEAAPRDTEVPESLQALVEAGILDEADLELAMAEMTPEELAAQQAEEIPDWLKDLMEEAEAEGIVPAAVEMAEEVGVSGEEAAPEEEIPAWLREVEEPVAKEVAPEKVEAPVEEAVPEEEIPAWLREAEEPVAEETVPKAAEALIEEAAPEEGIPAWLREAEEPSAEEVAPSLAGVPDSLQALVEAGILDEASLAAALAEMTPEDLEAQRTEEIPDWLQDLMGEAEVPAVKGATLAVVEELVEEVAPVEEEPVEEVAPVEEVTPPLEHEMLLEEPLLVGEAVPPPELERAAAEALPLGEAAPSIDVEMVAPFDRVEVEEVVPGPTRIEGLLMQLEGHPRDYRARLELARAYQDERAWEAALSHYEKLISARKFLPAVIDDLEGMAREQTEKLRLFQLLGDAYMQEDRLDEALKMYRQARKMLLKR